MAFLDNSGDIILDAVLTDTGRMRLAKGDGSFRIVKFALGDDEIDYSNYNKDHTSGSAYFDLDIMQTPVLEAFTNNASSMKNRLISFSRTDLLYMPVIKLNENTDNSSTVTAAVDGKSMFFVAVDTDTRTNLFAGASFPSTNRKGIIKGAPEDINNNSAIIRLDQGIDNTAKPATQALDADLVETQYIIQIDNRLGKVRSGSGQGAALSFVDDDNIASYYLSLNTDNQFVQENTNTNTDDDEEIIAGSRGTTLKLLIQASIDLNSSDFMFTQIGGANTITIDGNSYYYIDSNIRISGATTGHTVDVPVRFIKYTS
jgi:hypothetical protein|tara:strand:- start:1925 stop:2869 length:945 start_codon:yes stop_codon:yes gene_type:complete